MSVAAPRNSRAKRTYWAVWPCPGEFRAKIGSLDRDCGAQSLGANNAESAPINAGTLSECIEACSAIRSHAATPVPGITCLGKATKR